MLAVQDTGSGMTADQQARALEPFFTTKGRNGTGLGLAVVKNVTVKYAGALEIKSEPGVGTTVSVRLPHAGLKLEDRAQSRYSTST